MPRTYLTVTQDDIDAKLAENLHSREMELMSYDFERDNHLAAIAALGDLSWDDTTMPYRGLPRDQMILKAMSDGLDSTTIQHIADLNSLEHHTANLHAVAIETAKSERHYNSLLTALPAGKVRDTALAKFATVQAAKLAAPTQTISAQ